MEFEKNLTENTFTSKIDLDDRKYILIGSLIIALIFLFIVIWGFLVKIDTYVIAPGKVIVSTFKKPVQYPEWARVSKIFVKDGEFVKKGDPLIELEKFKEKAEYQVSMRNYYFLLAQRDRLLSEKKGFSRVHFSKEFLNCPDPSLREEFMNMQKELFHQRKNRLSETLAVLKSREGELRHRINGIKEMLAIKKELLKNYEKEILEQEELISLGLSNKYRLFELQNAKKTLLSDIEDLKSQLLQLQSQVEEVKKQQALEIRNYQNEVNQQLEDVLSRISSLVPQLAYAEEKVKKTLLIAPVSGQVIGLKVRSVDEVIKPGDTLLYIVPQKEEIFILAKVYPKDIDKVKVGQLVDLRFPSFISIAANVVEGKVVYVSSDTVPEVIASETVFPSSGVRHFEVYEAHIYLTEKGKKQLKKYNFNIVPGMPVIAYIKAEKVTPVEYLLNPVINLLKAAFRAI